MWVVADFQPVGLFSLRPHNATSSGGKSLLVPTPFSLKMALLDVLLTTQGRQAGQAVWATLRDAEIALRLPPTVVVNNTFVKILRPKKSGASDDNGVRLLTPMTNTIAFREYVQYNGAFGVAVRPVNATTPETELLAGLLMQLSYLGKRGGFIQPLAPAQSSERLPEGWTVLTREGMFPMGGTLQPLDDCGGAMTLDHADIYSGKKLGVGKADGRIIRTIVLPLALVSSSRTYSLYQTLAD
jgi:hypothetical protein